jgi:hypothetical protein
MKLITISAIAIAFVLTACGGSKLEGVYGADMFGAKGANVLTLKANGKAVVWTNPAEIDYEVINGKDVKLHSPMGDVVLKGHDDGSLDFPGMGNLKKVPSK